MQMRVAQAQPNVRVCACVCAGVCGEIFACLTESSLAQPSRGPGLATGSHMHHTLFAHFAFWPEFRKVCQQHFRCSSS